MATAPKPPTREIGNTTGYVASVPTWAQLAGDELEDVEELQWPESVRTYSKILDTEAQVQALALGITMPVRSQYRYQLNPGDLPDQLARAAADDFDLPLAGEDRAPAGRRRGRVSFSRHLASALRAPFVGHAVYEMVAGIDSDGIARLLKMAHRPQSTITRWTADQNGEWTGIEQGHNLKPIAIPRSKLVTYTWGDDSDGNPMGRPLLRSLYKHWLLKDIVLRIDAMQHQRHGVGIFKGKILDERGTGSRDDLLEIGADSAAGEDTAWVFPEGTDGELVGLTGSVTDPIASAKYHDEQMARALLGMVLQLGQTETGSRAVGDVQMDLLGMFVGSVASWIADILTEQALESWILWNLGEAGLDAGATIEAERRDDAPPTVDALSSLAAAGLVTIDDETEAWVREQLGMPPLSPLTITNRAVVDEAQGIVGDEEGAAFAADIGPASTMVALYPAEDVARTLAVPGGELPKDLHVTLAYLGDVPEDRLDSLTRTVRDVVGWAGLTGLTGEIAGSGAFTAGADPVHVALVDLPSLPTFRERLVQRLSERELAPSTAHGYTPHITLRYGDGPPIAVPNLPLEFDHVRIVRGNQEVARVPLVARPPDDCDHPASFAAGDFRDLTVLERLAGVQLQQLDTMRTATAADVLAMSTELRALLLDAATTYLAHTDVHAPADGPIAAAVGGGFWDQLVRHLLELVPEDWLTRMADRLEQAMADGAGEIVAEAKYQGADLLDVELDRDLAVQQAEEMAITIARTTASDVTSTAERLAPAGGGGTDTIVDDVRQALPDAPPRAIDDNAAGNSTRALFAGQVAQMRRNEALIDEVFAMELLDRNTCEPCAAVDGKVYDTLDDALLDYPTGRYKLCEGWDRCRGRLVVLWKTQSGRS